MILRTKPWAKEQVQEGPQKYSMQLSVVRAKNTYLGSPVDGAEAPVD